MILFVSGIFLFGFSVVMMLFSRVFHFDTATTDRPVVWFCAVYMMSFIPFLLLVKHLYKQQTFQFTTKKLIQFVFFIFISMRLVMLFSEPILENDVYRYVWDGSMLKSGLNPYTFSPETAFTLGVPSAPIEAERQIIYQKINYPHIPTIYPPVAQAFFGFAQGLSPWSLGGWRVLLILAESLTLLMLMNILRLLGRTPAWIILFAWNPLMLKEYSNSLHLDILAVCIVTLTVWFVLKQRYLLSWMALSLATGVKWYPVLFVAFLFLYQFKRQTLKNCWMGLSVYVGILVGQHLPFISPQGSMLVGLKTFAHSWQINDSFFSLVQLVLGLFLETFAADFASRVVVGIVLCGVLVMLGFRQWRINTFDALCQSCLIGVATAFFLAPTGNPWYFTWLIPFLVITPSFPLIVFCMLVPMYYLDFYFMDQGTSQTYYHLMRVVEYGPFYLWLLWRWVCHKPSH